MNVRSILTRVHDLVEEERRLREGAPGSQGGQRLARIEEELDRCWDLLWQPRTRPDLGDAPAVTGPRDAVSVEGRIG